LTKGQDANQSIDLTTAGVSAFLPITSRTVHLCTSRIFVPGILITVLGLSVIGIGGAIIFMLFWIVYVYSVTDKPLWIYPIPALLGARLSALLLRWLPANGLFAEDFIGGAVVEEIVKALPILIGLGGAARFIDPPPLAEEG
jgi:RsiW-degrading membrane proteinase PrsW (M82 family)